MRHGARYVAQAAACSRGTNAGGGDDDPPPLEWVVMCGPPRQTVSSRPAPPPLQTVERWHHHRSKPWNDDPPFSGPPLTTHAAQHRAEPHRAETRARGRPTFEFGVRRSRHTRRACGGEAPRPVHHPGRSPEEPACISLRRAARPRPPHAAMTDHHLSSHHRA